MNAKEQGNGVGQRARAKEKAWDVLLGKTKTRGGERRLETCQQSGQGEPQLLAPSHLHSFHKHQPNLRASSQGEEATLQPGRSSGLRREALLPRRGVTWGPNLRGSEYEHPDSLRRRANTCDRVGHQKLQGYVL